MPLKNLGLQALVTTKDSYPTPTDSKNASSVDIDDLELEAVGYRRQMPRQFSVFSLMSLSFALTCTWSGTGASMGVSLTEASSAGTIWSLPVAAVMTFIVSLGMVELASAYPIAGAQYYWSFMVSNVKYRPFAAYMTGWMCLLGWWLGAGSVCNFVASMVLGIATLWYPKYSIQHWHQWLCYCAIIWLAFLLNVFGSRLIPLFNKFIRTLIPSIVSSVRRANSSLAVFLACISLTATSITLLVCSRSRYPTGSWIFADKTNSTGWSSDGFAFILAVSNAVYAFLGTDCGAHLCEEIHNPGKNVPKVILYPVAMGLVTAFPFAVSCMAAITDLTSVLDTASGLPLIEIYYQGTGSRVATTILMVLFAVCFFGCAVANGTTSSRTMWAISRDGALPFSRYWMQVSPRFEMPVNAILLSATVVSLYGLIFLGSTTAFSAMIGVAIIFLQTACVVPQAILLYRGRDKVLPPRYFSLGRYGTAINLTAVAWVLFLDVVYFLPTAMPVTTANMNYVSVVTVGLTAFITGLWFVSKRRTFTGPRINLEEIRRRREQALHGVILDVVDEKTGSDPEVGFGMLGHDRLVYMRSATPKDNGIRHLS